MVMMFVFLYRCKGLLLLETYTTNKSADFEVPPFLEVEREVTGDLDYSMYNLSKKLDPQPSLTSDPHDDPTTVEPETVVEENAASESDTTVDEGFHSMLTGSADDSMEDRPVEETAKPEPSAAKVADSLLNGKTNGYHCDVERDQLTTLALNKLDICRGSALMEDCDDFLSDIADYERFAKLCHSGKSASAAVK